MSIKHCLLTKCWASTICLKFPSTLWSSCLSHNRHKRKKKDTFAASTILPHKSALGEQKMSMYSTQTCKYVSVPKQRSLLTLGDLCNNFKQSRTFTWQICCAEAQFCLSLWSTSSFHNPYWSAIKWLYTNLKCLRVQISPPSCNIHTIDRSGLIHFPLWM